MMGFRLRPLEEKDIPFMLSWMKDPHVNYFFQFDPEQMNETTVAQYIKDAQNESVHFHRACVDEKDEYLGTVSLKNIHPVHKTAEYAISFRTQAQGIGAAKYATNEILHIGFEILDLERVYLNVLEENVRACKFYEKNHFCLEGVSRKHILHRGTRKNLKWYGVLKEEWLSSKDQK